MRVAVTGASGFVARHLVPILLADGHEVRGLARHSPEHTDPAGTAPGFDFKPGDVRLRADVDRLLDSCQAVIHLAASFDPEDSVADINERGARTLIDAARDAGLERIVFLSCLGAEAASLSAFYRSKWRAEQMLRASEVPYVILQPSFVAGNGDGVVRPLARLLSALPVLPLPGDGCARMQPIDVADLCRCILAALTEIKYLEQTVPLGGPLYLTLAELPSLIGAVLGRYVPRVSLTGPLADVALRLLPAPARRLFTEPRRAQFEHGVVVSPGMVQCTFGFEPHNV